MADRYEGARENAQGWYESIREMVEALGDRRSNGDEHSEDAERRIHESALSAEVRSGWYSFGRDADTKPAEYRILLTTGGPALQLTGTLSEYGEPETAELQIQDWGVPWREWEPPVDTGLSFSEIGVIHRAYKEILLTFARCFYFGE